jgi:ABC-2 type transport system ATP-binding protein
MTPAVECHELRKTYRLGFLARKRVLALRGVSFTVAPGEVFGLIGPNGAGKSTTIKVLLNLVFPTQGEARIFGLDVRDPSARREVGYVPESPVPYEHLSGREYLELQGRLAGLAGPALALEVRRVLDRVEMGAHAGLRIRRYSKGMTQRVMLAGALLGRPRLLVLDEPTSGLDPLGRRLVRDVIIELRGAGAAILFCTHIISDVESLCDRVALLVGGAIRREGSVSDLVSGQARSHELVIEDVDDVALKAALGPDGAGLVVVGRRALLTVDDDRLQAVLAVVVGGGHTLTRVSPVRYSLEDAFLDTLKGVGAGVGGSLE